MAHAIERKEFDQSGTALATDPSLRIDIVARTLTVGDKVFSGFCRQRKHSFDVARYLCDEHPRQVKNAELYSAIGGKCIDPEWTGAELTKYRSRADVWCRQYVSRLNNELEALGARVRVLKHGSGRLRSYSLDLGSDIYFAFGVTGACEQESLACALEYYQQGGLERAIGYVEGPVLDSSAGWGEPSVAWGAVLGYLASKAERLSDRGEYLPYIRRTSLTSSEFGFFEAERIRLEQGHGGLAA